MNPADIIIPAPCCHRRGPRRWVSHKGAGNNGTPARGGFELITEAGQAWELSRRSSRLVSGKAHT